MKSKTMRLSLGIAGDPGLNGLSKAQKAFNTLVRQIEKRRARLTDWDLVTAPFQAKYLDVLLPLERTSSELRLEMVHRLNQVIDQKGLTKPERRTMSKVIAGIAGSLLEEREDAQLKAIYEAHRYTDEERLEAADIDRMSSMLETMFGVELGESIYAEPSQVDPAADAEEQEEWQQRQAAEELAREERRAGRKKTAKQRAIEAREESHRAQSGQSLREIYRRLASALHPDRESDASERERKTALMQRVNQAYGQADLLQLLKLQLELEHIDQGAINTIGEERLAHYNRILKEQIRALDQQVLTVEGQFRHAYGFGLFVEISPDTVLHDLNREIATVRQNILELRRDLLVFEDLKKLKNWLQIVKREQAARRRRPGPDW